MLGEVVRSPDSDLRAGFKGWVFFNESLKQEFRTDIC